MRSCLLFALLGLWLTPGCDDEADSGYYDDGEAWGEGEAVGGAEEPGAAGGEEPYEPYEISEYPSEDTQGQGGLTAGAWSDLENWAFWLGLEQRSDPEVSRAWGDTISVWSLETRGRVSVQVSREGAPAADVVLGLTDEEGGILWRTRTDINGRAELFAPTTGARCRLVDAEAAPLADVVSGGDEPTRVTLSAAPEPPARILDLALILDTTGSMCDELDYLQAELIDVVRRVQAGSAQTLQVRVSLSFYRDKGDEYILRAFPFTQDLERALSTLRAQGCGGGGDFPEAVGGALRYAVFDQEWSLSAHARIALLVLDAPPHRDTFEFQQIQEAAAGAAALGIRIIPVTASGVDLETEMLTRALAILTQGVYLFLTDHSGIGGEHLEPTIGAYDVRPFKDLLEETLNVYLNLAQP